MSDRKPHDVGPFAGSEDFVTAGQEADSHLRLAQKWRREILKESEHIKEGKSDGSEIARFEKADSYMA